ncbi:MAG: choline-sulfatase [Planctomycetes bacterium]|jgi:arylsulfatase A-like enzyme|nr:choline-sulfatase [Planctomycetota bacterium]
MFSLFFITTLALSQESPRPNVLFLFADDQRADTISAYGNEYIRTPELDRLSEAGFNFRRAYCMGSIHGAVCQPSRAMLMSGRSLYRVPMDLKDTPTLPELFRKAGYATFGTGKWHNGRESFKRSFETGRNLMFHGMSNHEAVPTTHLQADGSYTPEAVAKGFSSELFADAAIGFLESHEKDQPFFCYVSFSSPHDPRQPPEAYREQYAEGRPPLPPNFMPQHPFQNGWLVGRDEVLAPWPRPPEMIRDQLGEYYGMIAHMDAQIGRILRVLERRGMRENTLIVFTADHGLAVGSHGLLGKQNLYEHSMRTPLIVEGPGVQEGESDALVYLFDLFPTLCNAANVSASPGVEGLDLHPVMSGAKTTVRDTIFTTYEDLQRAVCDGDWKLIHYPKIARTQLFHLKEDPHELHDLSADPRQAQRLTVLFEELEEWRRRTDDPHPLHVDTPQTDDIDMSGRAREPDRHQPGWIIEKYFGGDEGH